MAVQQLPASVGIGLANWNWKAVHQFVWRRCGTGLCRSSCLNWLHRLGFAFKRPKKRLVKADEAKREVFAAKYAILRDEAKRIGGKIFFADEAHFRADAELRGKWALKGEPALVDSTSPRRGEKASYYSAVCLETGEVEWMGVEGNSNGESSVAFLGQLREKHRGPLKVVWDNAPAHRGQALREYLRTPGLGLELVNLPGYSPDFNADEAIWGWAREEATGNLCLGSKAAVQERVDSFLSGLVSRKDEVNAAAGPSFSQELKHSCLIPSLISAVRQMHIPPWLWFSQEWPGLRSVVKVVCHGHTRKGTAVQPRYYISSLKASAGELLAAVRAHWSIENSLHWSLDVTFREDQCRVRKDYGPQNLATLRQISHNLLKRETTLKVGIQGKRLQAGWREDYLLKVLLG